jgi:DNA primase
MPELLRKMNLYPNRSGFIYSIYKKESTPSLKIYDDGYFCYATSQGGDVIRFYKDYYRLTTAQAIDDLFRMVGGSNIEREKVDPPQLEQKKNIIDCLLEHEKYLFEEISAVSSEEFALMEVKKSRLENNKKIFAEMYNYCLKYSQADSFSKYMKSRMLSEETLNKFKVFYIENYFELNNHLKKKFQMDELKASGVMNEKGNLILAKHRIIIPYLFKNEIVYLRARYFDNGETEIAGGPKYIGLRNDLLGVNTAKRLFNSDILDGLVNGDRLFIVEGEFDAMVLSQEGFFAVAIPGVGNIPSMKWFKKMKGLRVQIFVDNDEAGEQLRDALHKILDSNSISYDDIYLKNYKDISDYARAI